MAFLVSSNTIEATTGTPVTGSIADKLITRGIAFPAIQVSSADPNTLDDYEEGTWTPTMYFQGAVNGLIYSSQIGTYTKVGRIVKVDGLIIWLKISSASDNVGIGGLPFVSAYNNFSNGALLMFNGWASPVGGSILAIGNNSTFTNIMGEQGSGNLSNSFVDNTYISLRFSLTYIV